MNIEKQISSDVAKETFTVLSFYNKELLDDIPDSLLRFLIDLAADSNKDYYIDKNKELSDQNLSDECKDLLATIYYIYNLDEVKRNIMMETLIKNNK